MGKPGYINSPSADWVEDRPLGFSFGYLPSEYSIFTTGHAVQFYNARLDVTSFMSINLSVAYRREQAEQNKLGIGDRHIDFRFRLLREKEYLPSIVLGWTPPGSVAPYLAHDYLVATKNFKTGLGKFQVNAGYGSPWVFLSNSHADSFLDLHIEKKIDTRMKSDYLTGFFGGVSWQPLDFIGLMLEYDSNTVNGGLYIKPWEWMNLQAYTYEGKTWGISTSLNFVLDLKPKALKDEKLD